MIRGDLLKPKQRRAIHLILEGRLTQREMAEELRVTRQTLRNWTQMPEFQTELRLATDRIQRRVEGRLTGVADQVITALMKLALTELPDPAAVLNGDAMPAWEGLVGMVKPSDRLSARLNALSQLRQWIAAIMRVKLAGAMDEADGSQTLPSLAEIASEAAHPPAEVEALWQRMWGLEAPTETESQPQETVRD